jgi:hypothetical protein
MTRAIGALSVTINHQRIAKASHELITDHLYSHYLAQQSQSQNNQYATETFLPRIGHRNQHLAQ